MKIIPVLLVLAPLALPAGADKGFFSVGSAESPETKSRFAMLDDVRILANGLLQLGHGLKDFVHKTKGQMNDISQKLYIFDKSFYELSLQTSEIKEEEEQLRQTTARLQINNEEIKNLSQEMNLKIEDLIQNKIQLQEQVWGLEDKVTKLAVIQPSVQETEEISSLKAFVEQQDNDIKQLVKIVEDQHVQLDRQHNQIMELEDKLNHIEFQELLENSFMGDHPEPETIPSAVHKPTAGTYRAHGAAADCTALFHTGVQDSGVYTIQPNGSEAFNVYCEMKFGTSWTVIQKRVDGSLDFNQTWDAYANGFGDLNEEFWLGLNKIYSITKQGNYLLRIELQDWRGNRRHIEYSFSLGGPSTNFTLQLARTAGSIPNALPEHAELRFSTADRAADTASHANCPKEQPGGWWHSECEETNLNGKYVTPRSRGRLERGKGLYWKPKKGRYYLLKSTKIMIHPTDLKSFD
uniref:Angiopoietin-related protein 3 n=1 Tax=Cyanoderma ruficeps TaxID=181631 RepID=A0A8C3QN21_9PASS